MDCSFTCPGNYSDDAPPGECESRCYRCASGCYSCNDVYNWCNLFTSGGSCRAGNGVQCTNYA